MIPTQGGVPNLNSEIGDKIAESLGLLFVSERTGEQASLLASVREDADERGEDSTREMPGAVTPEEPALQAGMLALQSFAPIDILDYIYAVLHSPSYREKYKEFLQIDFPRVPYPKDKDTFWQLVALGGELRQIHLLESPKVDHFITGYNVGGDNIVEKPKFVTGAASILLASKNASKTLATPVGDVYINETQYFSNVPETAWNFYIGGYQPAQKWLKDRKGRDLNFEDIQHYQKIIVALTETDRIMKKIDTIDFMD